MQVIICVDLTGWFESGTQKINHREWDSVSTEHLTIEIRPVPFNFPDPSDIAATRRFFRDDLRRHCAAIIDCDLSSIGNLPAVKLTSKSPVGKGPAMSYTSELLTRYMDRLVALSISCGEFGITGLREAVGLCELLRNATPDQKASMKKGLIPLEWKFERYEPGTRGEFAYLLSDDEEQDARYPWHPLSIVRRRMRWIERSSLALSIDNLGTSSTSSPGRGDKKGSLLSRFARGRGSDQDNLHLALNTLPDKLLIERATAPIAGREHIAQELGEDIAEDISTDPNVPLAVRQQEYRNRVVRQQQEIAKSNGISTTNAPPKGLAQSQHHEISPALKQELEQITQELPALMLKTDVKNEKCWSFKVPPQHGWLGMKMNDQTVAFPVFSSLALAENFVSRKGLDVTYVEMNALDLWRALPEIRKAMTHFLLNPCPDCVQFASTLLPLLHFKSDAKILEFLVLGPAVLRAKSKFALDSIQAEKDPKNRLAALCNFVVHVDPANPEVHLELVQLGLQQSNAPVAIESARRIFKYSPTYLPKLAHLLYINAENGPPAVGAQRPLIQAAVMATIWAAADLQDHYSTAINFYEECIAAKQDDFLAHTSLGSALWYAGELDRSIDVYSRALLLAPDTATVLTSRGQVYVEAGEYDKALSDLEQSLQNTAPVNLLQDEALASARAFPLNGKGAALSGLGQFDLAHKCFNESVALCPKNAWVYFNMASAFEKQGDFEAAVRNYLISLKMTGPKLNLLKKTAALARLAILDPVAFGTKPE